MAYHGSPQCEGCSAEDCVCCEVYIEEQANARSLAMYGPPEDDYYEDDDWGYEDEDEDDGVNGFGADPGEMDGDHASALESVYGPEDMGDFGYWDEG